MSLDLKKLSESLNDFQFSVQLPSTGDIIYGRPYTVRDEFSLAQAAESKDQKLMFNTLFELIKRKYHSLKEEQLENLTMIDFLALLIKLKIQSDDREIPLLVKCSKCGNEFKYKMDLTKIGTINAENFKREIEIKLEKLETPIILTIKSLSFKKTLEYANIKDKLMNSEEMMNILKDIIESVSYNGEKTDMTTSEEDLTDFLNDIPKKKYEEITDFLNNQPELAYTPKAKCTHAGCLHENTISVDDFFYLFF